MMNDYVLMYAHLREVAYRLAREAVQVCLRHPEEVFFAHCIQKFDAEAWGVLTHEGKTKLAPRQLEFARLYVRGYSIAEAAAKMGTTQRTAEKNRNEVYRKLNVDSKVGLALWMIAHGLFPIPTPRNLDSLGKEE